MQMATRDTRLKMAEISLIYIVNGTTKILPSEHQKEPSHSCSRSQLSLGHSIRTRLRIGQTPCLCVSMVNLSVHCMAFQCFAASCAKHFSRPIHVLLQAVSQQRKNEVLAEELPKF